MAKKMIKVKKGGSKKEPNKQKPVKVKTEESTDANKA
jgi:hypothetical protein